MFVQRVDSPESEGPLVFREARSAEELLSLFRLRQQVIRESGISRVLQHPDWDVDIDEWDAYAHHFGLFDCRSGEEVPIGYERGISAEVGPLAELVRSLALKFGSGSEPTERSLRYPFLGLFDGQAQIDLAAFEARATTQGARLGESGRFLIAKPYRSPRVGRFFVEAVLAAYFFKLGFDLGITVVTAHHEPFYRRAGFQNVLGRSVLSPVLRTEVAAMAVSMGDISPRIRPRVERYAEEFVQHLSVALLVGHCAPAQIAA